MVETVTKCFSEEWWCQYIVICVSELPFGVVLVLTAHSR
jgi:hypothetical protein